MDENLQKPKRKTLTESEKLQKLLKTREQKLNAIENAKEDLKQVDEKIEKIKIQISQSTFKNIDNEELVALTKLSDKSNLLKLFMEGNYEELEKLREHLIKDE